MSSFNKTLIIGGASKAGTTSLFNYLADHAQVCASTVKETRFFLDKDYPLPSALRYQDRGAAAYESFFACDDIEGRLLRLEATPDYLFSPRTPGFISEALTNVRFVFVLREPISRLISYYRFGRSMGLVSPKTSFDRYIQVQRDVEEEGDPAKIEHPAFFALAHGRYSNYLKNFLDVFGRAAVHVEFHENLSTDPDSLIRRVCEFAHLEEGCYRNYSFSVANPSMTVRSAIFHNFYWKGKRGLRRWLNNAERTRHLLRSVGARVDRVYGKINAQERGQTTMSGATAKFLTQYYGQETARLQEMLGIEIPWRRREIGTLG